MTEARGGNVWPFRRRALVAFLVPLVVLAGCSGFADPGRTPPVAVTPAPVPTDTPSPDAQLAPGVAADGDVDPLALADAHAAVLRNTSETVRTDKTSWYAETWILRSHRGQVTRVAADHDRFHTVVEVDGPAAPFFGDRLEFWSDGERLFQRIAIGNETTDAVIPFEAYRQRTDVVIGSPGSGTIHFLFSVVETRLVDTVTRNGTTLYWIESTRLTQPRLLASAEDVSDPHDVELRAFVDSRGVVRSFRLAYSARVDGRRIWVEWKGRHTDIGSTTVERPAWYDEAVNTTGG